MTDWHVIGRDEAAKELVVECTQTAIFGRVPNPTAIEWARAEYASRAAYRWGDASRVVVARGDETAISGGGVPTMKCPDCGQIDIGQERTGGPACKTCGLPVEAAAETESEKVISK